MPAPGELPCPWVIWTLIGLVRHRDRQVWVGEIVSTRLQGDMGQVATFGALGHPEARPETGTVPGMPEWEYRFHGRGRCLTHKVNGEEVDVDFHGEDAEAIDCYFYLNYLRSLRRPPEPERRLVELHPSVEAISLAVDELREVGLLEAGASHVGRLSSEVLSRRRSVTDFCAAWQDETRRPELAGWIGDWEAADAMLKRKVDSKDSAWVTRRAEETRSRRLQQLHEEYETGHSDLALMALADMRAAGLPELLTRTLHGPVSRASLVALDQADARADAAEWCADVYALFGRADPGGQPLHPYP
jgi:hypothetical protein